MLHCLACYKINLGCKSRLYFLGALSESLVCLPYMPMWVPRLSNLPLCAFDCLQDFHTATGMIVTAGEQLQAGTQNMKTALANLNTLKDTNTMNLVFPDAQYIPEVTDEDMGRLRGAQTSVRSCLGISFVSFQAWHMNHTSPTQTFAKHAALMHG